VPKEKNPELKLAMRRLLFVLGFTLMLIGFLLKTGCASTRGSAVGARAVCNTPELVITAKTVPEEYAPWVQEAVVWWNWQANDAVLLDGGRAVLLDDDFETPFVTIRLATKEKSVWTLGVTPKQPAKPKEIIR
jgi:adenylosuccinate synthase